mmetsp:Transcript_5079/g.17320  ORF Transcript_5079/g.17320 Transcript_5079/m.17320 type:complete len:150 (-) Transcript_5079:120-569(-)
MQTQRGGGQTSFDVPTSNGKNNNTPNNTGANERQGGTGGGGLLFTGTQRRTQSSALLSSSSRKFGNSMSALRGGSTRLPPPQQQQPSIVVGLDDPRNNPFSRGSANNTASSKVVSTPAVNKSLESMFASPTTRRTRQSFERSKQQHHRF